MSLMGLAAQALHLIKPHKYVTEMIADEINNGSAIPSALKSLWAVINNKFDQSDGYIETT